VLLGCASGTLGAASISSRCEIEASVGAGALVGARMKLANVIATAPTAAMRIALRISRPPGGDCVLASVESRVARAEKLSLLSAASIPCLRYSGQILLTMLGWPKKRRPPGRLKSWMERKFESRTAVRAYLVRIGETPPKWGSRWTSAHRNS
jgi:hypothetical protein